EREGVPRRRRRYYNGPPLPPFILIAFLRDSRGFRFRREFDRCLFVHPDKEDWPLVLPRPRENEDHVVDRSVIDEMFTTGVKQGFFASIADDVKELEQLSRQVTQDADLAEAVWNEC